MNDENRRDPDEPDDIDAVERWVLPYFRDSSLWPVLLVILAALISFVAFAVLFAVRDRVPVGIVATGLLVVSSVQAVRWEWRLRGRPGAIAAAIAAVWALAMASAWYGARSGFL